jgi:hypothetical protein
VAGVLLLKSGYDIAAEGLTQTMCQFGGAFIFK